MVICSDPGHADRQVPPRLTGTGNVLTSRLCHEECHAHHCHVTAGSMQQMLLLARHKSYWDARYVRCKALRRTLQCATPGAEDEQRAAGDRISFLAGSGAPGVPGQRYCHDVTKTRGHVSRVTLTMSILTIRSNTQAW